MKLYLFAILAAFSALPAHAEGASDLASQQRVEKIQSAVNQACSLPLITKPYSRYALNRYTSQTEFPELKMLSTAFLVGFEAMRSDLLEYGYCVIVFMGLPNDSNWEPNHGFYEKAKDAGHLPTQMFGGFKADGTLLLKAVERRN